MKNVVTLDEIREVELRPQEQFAHYMSLLNKDIPYYLSNQYEEERIACPGCHAEGSTEVFMKLGFHYLACNQCGSLYVREIPTNEALNRYYQESPSHQFYVQEYLTRLESKTHQEVFYRRVNWILDAVVEYGAPREFYLDLGTKYPAILEQIIQERFFEKAQYYSPFWMKESLRNSVAPIERLANQTDHSISVLSAFDYLDGIFRSEIFVQHVKRVLAPRGILVLTTRTISGFDLQILGEHAKSILPPNRVTLFSIEGLVALFENYGLTVRELSTPGQLDLEVVANFMRHNPQFDVPPFIRYLIEKRDQEAHQSFKAFLQQHRLSSHARLVVQA